MESRILVDTNILLDYLMKREPFYPYAKEFGAEYIVTRNTDDYKTSAVPAVSPKEYLERF